MSFDPDRDHYWAHHRIAPSNGAYRSVYVFDDFVLKVAKDNWGALCNLEEFDVSFWRPELPVAKCLWVSTTGALLVQERVTEMFPVLAQWNARLEQRQAAYSKLHPVWMLLTAAGLDLEDKPESFGYDTAGRLVVFDYGDAAITGRRAA